MRAGAWGGGGGGGVRDLGLRVQLCVGRRAVS